MLILLFIRSQRQFKKDTKTCVKVYQWNSSVLKPKQLLCESKWMDGLIITSPIWQHACQMVDDDGWNYLFAIRSSYGSSFIWRHTNSSKWLNFDTLIAVNNVKWTHLHGNSFWNRIHVISFILQWHVSTLYHLVMFGILISCLLTLETCIRNWSAPVDMSFNRYTIFRFHIVFGAKIVHQSAQKKKNRQRN